MKDETQHRNEGSFEEFIESEKKGRRARYKKHWLNLAVNLPNPIYTNYKSIIKK